VSQEGSLATGFVHATLNNDLSPFLEKIGRRNTLIFLCHLVQLARRFDSINVKRWCADLGKSVGRKLHIDRNSKLISYSRQGNIVATIMMC
jgi:hypothetical protein